MYFTNEGVPEKNSRVNSVNCSLSALIVCSDCLVLILICETKDYLKSHQESFRPLKNRVALLSTIAQKATKQCSYSV